MTEENVENKEPTQESIEQMAAWDEASYNADEQILKTMEFPEAKSNGKSPRAKYYQTIMESMKQCYIFEGKDVIDDKEISLRLTPEKIKELEEVTKYFAKAEERKKMEEMELPELDTPETQEEADEEEKVLAVMNSKYFADLVRLKDRYAIRLGDGASHVASDEIIEHFVDPSDHPAWQQWFLSAVSLSEIPNRLNLLLCSEDEQKAATPKPDEHGLSPNQPILCHATLWDLGNGKTGVQLHTAWNQISASYFWAVDKSMEACSILFKVNHPAQLARNFGFMPQIAIPGDVWFGVKG